MKRAVLWIIVFFALLAAMLFPLLLMAAPEERQLSFAVQAGVVALTSVICQLLRRRPLAELTGALNGRWLRQLLAGCGLGASLMLLPALFLRAIGAIHWQMVGGGFAIVVAALPPAAAIVIAEELIFRGFIFQRLLDGFGEWPAQLVLAAYFVLTHSAALRDAGPLKTLAAVNIFIASLAFGLAYLRTRGLAMPLGLHFAANVTQGPLLGFGVSGHADPSASRVAFTDAPPWLTGGAFGLEASVPGLVCVIALAVLLYRVRPPLGNTMASTQHA
ncbi:MAG TPA: CPBP family intramembrane glutamic endopeptidase [Thermoanaerobaculia bacterium]|nr:CPBP family intramembrane glutamic endopeptidase [Thermoanaerobaculia bacterium]